MVGIALAIRLVVVAFVFRGVSDPAHGYGEFGQEVGWIARSIALHHGFASPYVPLSGPTALLPPLYPYLLAAVFRVFGIYTATSAVVILSLNSLFSALTCIPIYFATRTSVNPRVAAFTGWAWAVYPFAIYFSAGRVWEYSLTALLFTTCFWIFLGLPSKVRPTIWLGFGLLYGVTALSNPAVLSTLPFLLLVAMFRNHRAGGAWVRNGLLAAVGVFAVVTPWTVRNYRTLHVVCPIRDSFWDEFWAGNNGDTSNPTLTWAHPASNPAELRLYQATGEIPYVARKRATALAFVEHHPVFFASLTLRRTLHYWTGFWSFAPGYVQSEPFQLPNMFFCTSLTLLMLFGMRSWWRERPAEALPYLLLVLIFPLPYYVTHPLMDYRQPIEPEIVVFIAVGVQALRARLKSRATLRLMEREERYLANLRKPAA